MGLFSCGPEALSHQQLYSSAASLFNYCRHFASAWRLLKHTPQIDALWYFKLDFWCVLIFALLWQMDFFIIITIANFFVQLRSSCVRKRWKSERRPVANPDVAPWWILFSAWSLRGDSKPPKKSLRTRFQWCTSTAFHCNVVLFKSTQVRVNTDCEMKLRISSWNTRLYFF